MNFWDESIAPLLSRPDTAGVVGSIVGSFVGSIPGTTRMQRVFNMVGGMLIAYYVGPFISEGLGVQNVRAQTGLGFLVGILGLSTLTQINASLKAIDWKSRIESVLDRIFGVRKP